MLRAKPKILTLISLLLVLCLSALSIQAQGAAGLQERGAGRRNAHFIYALANVSASVFTLDSRTGASAVHGIFPDAWIPGTIRLGSFSGCLRFLHHFSASLTHCAERSIFPIRAPPCPTTVIADQF